MSLVAVLLFPAFGFAAAGFAVRSFIKFERRHHAIAPTDFDGELAVVVATESVTEVVSA
jgi:hypothetical protein